MILSFGHRMVLNARADWTAELHRPGVWRYVSNLPINHRHVIEFVVSIPRGLRIGGQTRACLQLSRRMSVCVLSGKNIPQLCQRRHFLYGGGVTSMHVCDKMYLISGALCGNDTKWKLEFDANESRHLAKDHAFISGSRSQLEGATRG